MDKNRILRTHRFQERRLCRSGKNLYVSKTHPNESAAGREKNRSSFCCCPQLGYRACGNKEKTYTCIYRHAKNIWSDSHRTYYKPNACRPTARIPKSKPTVFNTWKTWHSLDATYFQPIFFTGARGWWILNVEHHNGHREKVSRQRSLKVKPDSQRTHSYTKQWPPCGPRLKEGASQASEWGSQGMHANTGEEAHGKHGKAFSLSSPWFSSYSPHLEGSRRGSKGTSLCRSMQWGNHHTL